MGGSAGLFQASRLWECCEGVKVQRVDRSAVLRRRPGGFEQPHFQQIVKVPSRLFGRDVAPIGDGCDRRPDARAVGVGIVGQGEHHQLSSGRCYARGPHRLKSGEWVCACHLRWCSTKSKIILRSVICESPLYFGRCGGFSFFWVATWRCTCVHGLPFNRAAAADRHISRILWTNSRPAISARSSASNAASVCSARSCSSLVTHSWHQATSAARECGGVL